MTEPGGRDESYIPLPCPGCAGKGVNYMPHMAIGPLRGHLRSGQVATLLAAGRCEECLGNGRLRRPKRT
ncbi:hypothetical protein [Stackebrandtia nassauensis]|uniref:Uncharacterized protein n=1 Tax=Stackebrandtia nassauensis (strain DSM 44728 / CIP 108903 / NRRL B-16338 / NBRC 102104 / LLR-40K-21) TaxID=446470 RepID=D3Q2B8_STANL|nr:hypothetical protein [Stackebrandtia nassauensis]ADD43851.1 hypothetical protein Snas_4201 [Stackebrandtia nassauensis DSM 44728]